MYSIISLVEIKVTKILKVYKSKVKVDVYKKLQKVKLKLMFTK